MGGALFLRIRTSHMTPCASRTDIPGKAREKPVLRNRAPPSCGDQPNQRLRSGNCQNNPDTLHMPRSHADQAT